MNDEPPNGTGAEELMMAKIGVERFETAGTQAKALAVVQALAGVRSASVFEGKLQVIYDPLAITEHEIEDALRRTGVKALEGTADRESPFSDL